MKYGTMSYGLTQEKTKNSFIQAHCSLVPTLITTMVNGNSKVGFLTNYCDLKHPKLSRAQVWVSARMCLSERSKSVYKPTEKTEHHFFPVIGI